MAGQILIPLKRHDRIEQILPYIENIAQPGMRVVFLIPYPVAPWLWLRDHWVITESAREAMMAGRKIMERYSCDVQMRLAEQRVVLARQALRKIGVETAVDVYTGRLRRVVESYRRGGNVHWIMLPVGSGIRIMSFLLERIPLPGFFKRPALYPVLLLYPDHGV